MKKYKVKHYRSRIYNPVRGKIIKGVLIGIIAASIFGIGWFAYEPLMQAVNERNKEIIASDPVPEKPKEEAFEPAPEEFLDKETFAVTVPEEVLYSSLDYYDFLTSLDEEVTAVVIDMKTKSGTVTYQSDYVSVASAGAVHEKAANLENRISTAEKLGFDVIARIHAFEDSTAPYNANEMAIRYESEEGVLWLDDSIDNGGKPWLNPYSDTAQKYILDIVCDAIDYGVDAILLEGVRFPENEGMDYAYFGAGSENVSRSEILLSFAKRIYTTAVVTETDIIFGYDSFAVFSGSDIYGGSPLLLPADGYAPYINLNDYVGKKFSSEFYYRNMPEDPTELFGKIYDSLGGIDGLDIMPVLDFGGFIRSDTKGIEEFLREKHVSGYIIIHDADYFANVIPEPEIPEETPGEANPVIPEIPSPPQPEETPSVPVTPSYPEEEDEDDEDGEGEGITIIDHRKENNG